MSALIFLFAVATIFGAVLGLEARGTEAELARRPLGLIGWLTGGNWPAKIGGALLVVGLGALLRYALVNLEFSPTVKLGAGAATAGLLGLAATLTRIGTARRAVSLALGGAAFGVAYLTAYSAFALFQYLESSTGIALLALTAIGAGVYAISRSALSLALLAMIGAYLAPAFALDDPGPGIVYGYLAAASLLTLVMVAARGWRPLIHLSFLFTLGGATFFAWTAQYYNPEHAPVMLPVVLVLAALHALMPIVERQTVRGTWIERLDLVYLLALPVFAALSALLVAPGRTSLSNELLALAAIWLLIAAGLAAARRDGAVVHAVIGLLLGGAAVAARFRDLPWELTALAFAVVALWLAARRSRSERLQSALAGLVPVLGVLHVLSSLAPAAGSAVFFNGRFLERLIGAGLMVLAGYICRRIRHSLDTLLLSVGFGWGVIAIGLELLRWDLVSASLLVHWLFLAAAVTLALVRVQRTLITDALIVVSVGVAVTAAWAAIGAPASVSWISLAVAPLVLIWLSIRRAGIDPETRTGRLLAAVMAPIVAGLWGIHAGALAGIHVPQFALSAAALAALLLVALGSLALERCRDWLPTALEIASLAFAVTLALATTVAISRSPWAITLELLALLGLAWLAASGPRVVPLPRWVGPAAVLGVGLVLETNLLRLFGPAGDLHFIDVTRMELTALVSLLWAALGASLTVWSLRRASRTLWMGGATLLVAAAAKFVLLDFGSLGQLGNILAVIAAGIVFLLVGWLAPMPPAAPPVPKPQPRPAVPLPDRADPAIRPAASVGAAPAAGGAPDPHASMKEYFQRNASEGARDQPREAPPDSSPRIAWTVVILAALVLPLAQCGGRIAHELLRRSLPPSERVSAPPVTPPPRSAGGAAISITGPARSGRDGRATDAALTDPSLAPECGQWAARLPADYTVLVAGANEGRELDFTIDESTLRASSFNVSLNVPDRDVVLMLGAYRPSVWTIRWSRATHIVGVWVSGYSTQRITGLPEDVPLLVSPAVARSGCPYFYLSDRGAASASRAAQQLLKHRIDGAVLAADGEVVIGEVLPAREYVQGKVVPVESFRDMSRPLAGERGLEELMRQGRLRRATVRDLESWHLPDGATPPLRVRGPGGEEVPLRTYVVREQMIVPADLYGADAVTFLVPPGVARPTGNPGRSRIIELE